MASNRLAPMPPPLCNRRGFLRPTTITPLGMAPPRQARTHRHRVRMTTTPEPGRLPSIRLRPRGRSRPDCARFYTRSLQPRTLSSAAIRSGPVTRRGGRFKLPLASKRPSRTAPALQGRCVSPMSAIDSRHEHPANRSIPGFASTSLATRFVRPPAAGAASFTWVEHRLTATLQLRLSTSYVSLRQCPGFTPRMVRTRYRSVLAGAAIDDPSGDIPRPRCFRPRSEVTT
jgi:hypothetical protein